MRTLITCLLGSALFLAGSPLVILASGKASDRVKVSSQFDVAVYRAEEAIDKGEHDVALFQIDRALERDPKSPVAWGLRAEWAEAIGDTDELVYALHKQYRLLVKQDAKRSVLEPIRKKLDRIDPLADTLLTFRDQFISRLLPIAERYEAEGRPHSAIRVHQEILSLDPEREESILKIEEISASPDPTLAATAKPKDLLEGISQEWIRQFDQKHGAWDRRSKLEKTNYITQTDAGYEVMVRTGEAMEQMNGFYREWFQYGTRENPGSVPRIFVNIFKNRTEYLELGIGPPVEWSGGHFTGSAVETYMGGGGFEQMTGTLFHEAAHQFVSLATSATGWLNEGIASFFEGTRILANGTVRMNLPANHRLFPLARRMENGWMESAEDGINPSNPSGSSPEKAPTFQIIIENEYAWGPPWYAPTWGFVFFLYNYQDPVDGRFVYRKAFQEFIDSSGGRVGKGAIENFEQVVVRNPSRRTPGIDPKEHPESIRLPRNTNDLNEVWKEYILELRDQQTGRSEVKRPYLDWARYALKRKERTVAKEHFEKGIIQDPQNIEMLVEFAALLADRYGNRDRASKLVLQAIQVLELADEPDQRRIDELEKMLGKWDPKRRDVNKIRADLREGANDIAQQYYDAGLYMMTMDVSLRFAREFRFTELFDLFERAARKAEKSLALWRLAYNEVDLDGWETTGNDTFQPYGSILRSAFGKKVKGKYDFRFLTMKTVTSGDFSMETEIYVEYDKASFAGLVFGNKSASSFHALFLMPGGTAEQTGNFDQKGYLDLTTFYGAGDYKVWRHNSVDAIEPAWHKLRVDVTGTLVDVWFDGEPIVTHDFKNLDVLRGRFGLITGPGEAKFRNVRFLAREARDPAAWIERQLRMEKYSGPDASVGGSWMNRVPPFPEVDTWLTPERKSWRDMGPVPTLLLFWSPRQNDHVRLDEWLTDLEARYSDIGLQIVAISEPDEPEKIRHYLEQYPYPGSIAVDALDMRKGGFGKTFEKYGIGKYFNLPRLVLLDVNHKVIWEGDPGFELNKPWKGEESYLETPLKDLIETRMLRRVAGWLNEYESQRDRALTTGDFEALIPILKEAGNLPGDYYEDVADAQRLLGTIENAIENLLVVIEDIIDAGCEPAVATLVEWADALERPVDFRAVPTAKTASKKPNGKAWTRAMKIVQDGIKRAKPGKEEAQVKIAIAKLEPVAGEMPKRLRAAITEAYESEGVDSALDVMRTAKRIPAKWLIEDYFKLE